MIQQVQKLDICKLSIQCSEQEDGCVCVCVFKSARSRFEFQFYDLKHVADLTEFQFNYLESRNNNSTYFISRAVQCSSRAIASMQQTSAIITVTVIITPCPSSLQWSNLPIYKDDEHSLISIDRKIGNIQPVTHWVQENKRFLTPHKRWKCFHYK